MPDKQQIENSIPYKFKDLGDGTFARVVSLDSSTVSLTGPVTVSNEVEIKNDSGSPVPTEPLGIPTISRQLTVTSTSSSVNLTTTCKRISIRARSAPMRFVVGTGSQTATTTSHFIGQDERLDLAIPLNGVIAAIRDTAATSDGTLTISELG